MKQESTSGMTESLIRIERVYKKYKYYIFGFLILLIIYIISSISYDYLEQKKLEKDNALYTFLLKNEDEAKLKALKESNINLYALLILSKNQKAAFAEAIKNPGLDKILKEILLLKEGKNSTFLRDYSFALKGFEYLEKKDFKRAKIEFNKINPNSTLYPLITSLRHFQVAK